MEVNFDEKVEMFEQNFIEVSDDEFRVLLDNEKFEKILNEEENIKKMLKDSKKVELSLSIVQLALVLFKLFAKNKDKKVIDSFQRLVKSAETAACIASRVLSLKVKQIQNEQRISGDGNDDGLEILALTLHGGASLCRLAEAGKGNLSDVLFLLSSVCTLIVRVQELKSE